MNHYRQFDILRLAASMLIFALLIYFIIVTKSILMPVTFAGIIAFLLNPINKRIRSAVSNQFIAAGLTIILALSPLVIVFALFSWQLVDVLENMPSISQTLGEGLNSAIQQLAYQFGISNFSPENWVNNNISALLETPLSFLGSGISSSGMVIANLFIVLIFTFFLLLYSKSLKILFLLQFGEENRGKARSTLGEVQEVVQRYLMGLLTVILILSILNSLGLWLIGLEHAWFWGLLAACLAIIPYVGTFIGGLLPFMFAIATTDTWWQPMAVVALFVVIQFVEGNLITPKVIGDSIKINPFFAIISLLLGGMIWGVAGIVLALPIMAILRIMFQQIPLLMPFGALLGSDLYKRIDEYETTFDAPSYRLSNFFKRKTNDK
jgi:predicted PurR-regulated permease PerM